jgi:hypothetical protein
VVLTTPLCAEAAGWLAPPPFTAISETMIVCPTSAPVSV